MHTKRISIDSLRAPDRNEMPKLKEFAKAKLSGVEEKA